MERAAVPHVVRVAADREEWGIRTSARLDSLPAVVVVETKSGREWEAVAIAEATADNPKKDRAGQPTGYYYRCEGGRQFKPGGRRQAPTASAPLSVEERMNRMADWARTVEKRLRALEKGDAG